MKKLALLLSALSVVLLLASCFPNFNFLQTENSNDISEISENSVIEQSDEISDVTSAEEKTSYEVYKSALEKNDQIVSCVTQLEMSTKLSYSGEAQTFNGTVKQKVSGYGTEDAASYITYTSTNDEEGMIFRYKDGKGYYEDGKAMLSFDCTFDELDSFAYYYILPPDPEQGDVDVLELLKDKAVLEKSENGDITVSAKGFIASNERKKDILGSTYLMYDSVSELDVDISAVVNSDGYLVSLTSRMSFTAVYQKQKHIYEVENVMSVSDIDEDIDIVIPNTNYDYIGSYDNLYVFDSYYSLELLPAYSAKCMQNIKVENGGFDIDDIITNEANVIIGDKITFSLISDYNYIADGERYTYYTYFEDGIYYEKYLNDVYEEEIGNDYFVDATVAAWTYYCLTPNCGYDYVYTDNGDGTATLTFKYTDESIILLANAYAYNNLTEDYYDAFSDIMYGSSASSSVTYDIETGALIRHTYNIDASFSIDGDIVDYIESTEITVTTENVTVPEKEIFLGTSEF